MKIFCFSIVSVALTFAAMSFVADEFNSGGVHIHYAVQGKGDPVILLHGLYSSSKLNWDFPGTTALIAKHFQVVALDCRGHGQSDKPQAEDAYGTNMVEDVIRLMDHLKIPKARLAGYSMGGMIAMKLAVTHPDRVTRVVLGGMGWIKTHTRMHSVWDNMDRGRFKVPAACAHSFPAFGITESEIKSVKIPVEIIVGDRDPVLEWYVKPLQQIRPDWPVHLIAGAGHVNCILQPDFKTQLEKALH